WFFTFTTCPCSAFSSSSAARLEEVRRAWLMSRVSCVLVRASEVRITLVLRKKLSRREFKQAGALAHPRGCAMRRALQHRKVADQLARCGKRDAPFQILEFCNDLDRAANHQKAGVGRRPGAEEPAAARQLEYVRDREQLFHFVGVKALEERQQGQETAPVERGLAVARHLRQRISGGRRSSRRAVLLGGVVAHPVVQRPELLGQ